LLNFATGESTHANPVVVEIVDELSDWRTYDELAAGRSPQERRLLRRLLGLLVKRTLVRCSTARPSAIEEHLTRWDTWNPIAGLFHLATKELDFSTTVDDQVAHSRRKAAIRPLPSPLKSMPGKSIALPRAAHGDGWPSVLLARRTWRRFANRAVALTDLATLLQLTWGVQDWIEVPALGHFALKTSPSGGARHSIEVYVFARKVKGLRRGLYHYNPDTHRLVSVGQAIARRRVSDYMPGQPWYDDAAAVLLMTAVFERVQWRYPQPRAYRAVLAEAGHLCQTCCLVSTWLGLAPFCTMALADRRIEQDLAIDGVSESVIYAAGVGARPPDVEWAPWPRTSKTPTLTKPTHAKHRRAR
jgi:SagB-type dehydrogenase family enzyme